MREATAPLPALRSRLPAPRSALAWAPWPCGLAATPIPPSSRGWGVARARGPLPTFSTHHHPVEKNA